MPAANESKLDEAEEHECGHCGTPAFSTCKGCQNMRYCSKEHQIADWHIHKLLCKSFANFQKRPEERFFRAILFPADSKKPCFVWIPMPIEEVSLIDDDTLDESWSNIEDARDEITSIVEHEQHGTEEIGWEDARADPTGYEIPDTNVFDDRSEVSYSTDATSINSEDRANQSLKFLLRPSFDIPDAAQPNKCIGLLVNDRAGTLFRGSWELYGVSKAMDSGIDLDTTCLSLALLMISDEVFSEDCFEVGEEGGALDLASPAQKPKDLEMEDLALESAVLGISSDLSSTATPCSST